VECRAKTKKMNMITLFAAVLKMEEGINGQGNWGLRRGRKTEALEKKGVSRRDVQAKHNGRQEKDPRCRLYYGKKGENVSRTFLDWRRQRLSRKNSTFPRVGMGKYRPLALGFVLVKERKEETT